MKLMLRILLLCSFLAYLPIHADCSQGLCNSDRIKLDLPDYAWKCAFRQTAPNGQSIVEIIPINQTLDNRSEMITIQFHPKSWASSAVEFVNALYVQESQIYRDMQWNVLKQSDNDVIYEWILPNGYKNYPPQHEIVRIIWTTQGLHRIAYEKKTKALDMQTKTLWLNRIETAQLLH